MAQMRRAVACCAVVAVILSANDHSSTVRNQKLNQNGVYLTFKILTHFIARSLTHPSLPFSSRYIL